MTFKTELKKILDDAAQAIFEASENLAVQAFGPAGDGQGKIFGPPREPVKVECWHCGKKYLSDKMRYEYRPHMQTAVLERDGTVSPLWWCKDILCDGGGFGHDLHPIKAKHNTSRDFVTCVPNG